MKFAVCSYSLSSLIRTGEKTEAELLYLAKEMGFDAFEFSEINPPEDMEKKRYARTLRSFAKHAGIPIVQYSIGADFLYGSDGDLQKEIQRLKDEIDVAEALGVQGVRHDTTGGYKGEDADKYTFEDALARIIEGCRAVTEYAATKGIRTMTENHGYFSQDSLRVKAIVEGVNHPNFGTLVDIGNFLCVDENPADAVKNTSPYAFYVHAKDFCYRKKDELLSPDGFFKTRNGNYLKGVILGHGDVPVLEALKIIKENGYNGYVTLEFEGIEDAKLGCAYGLNTLKAVKEKLDW
ncbi:MAG: sugar phosphate isomerase/epimerase [Clostridia bacterium]|nr:sugar phosphate isomerase/epimerase [Clostridia bacterium]